MRARTGQRSRVKAGIVALALPVLLAGCSKASPASGTAAAPGPSVRGPVPGMRRVWGLHMMPGAVFHVEYSPDTSIVDMATVGRTLRGVSADHSIFLFDNSPELRARLIPGRFVLFEGLDLRKVDALALYKGQLVVGTERAPLNQALKSAHIRFRTPVNFADAAKNMAAGEPPGLPDPMRSLLDALQPPAWADLAPHNMEGAFDYADKDLAAWKIHYHFYVPDQGGKMHLDLGIKREANGLNVELNPKVEINNFIQEWAMDLNGGHVVLDFRQLNFDTDVDYEWTIKTSENKTPMNEVRFKIPPPAQISIPLMEETMLPMSLQISSALLFHPAFTTKEEVAKGGFHLKYSGDEGISVTGSQTRIEGQGTGDGAIDQTFAFSPFASFGLVVAMAVPRVELRMGTDELWDAAKIPLPSALTETLSDVLLNNTIAGQWLKKQAGNPLEIESATYLQMVISTTAAHSGMQSLVPCQQFTLVATGQAGFDGTWLGSNSNIPAKDLFTKNVVLRQPDSKICGGDK